jgi:hypothetical protein
MATHTPYPYSAQRHHIQEKNAKIGIRIITIPFALSAVALQGVFAARYYTFNEADEPLPATFALSVAFVSPFTPMLLILGT